MSVCIDSYHFGSELREEKHVSVIVVGTRLIFDYVILHFFRKTYQFGRIECRIDDKNVVGITRTTVYFIIRSNERSTPPFARITSVVVIVGLLFSGKGSQPFVREDHWQIQERENDLLGDLVATLCI